MVILFLLIFSFAYTQAPEINYDNKLLWEISKKGSSQKSYLYGGYHTNDKRVFQFSDSVYYALNKSKAIVLETDIYAMFKDWDTRQDISTINFDNKGNPYTSSRSATTTSYGDEDGMPQFLDLYFLQYGFNSNKDFYVLEPIEDQMDLVDNSYDLTNPYLNQYTGLAEKSLNLYLDGNIESIEKLLRANLRWNPTYFEKLITNRNSVMANGIDSLMKSGPLFISIGSGHLAGDKGVINLLRSKGYQLRPMISVYSKQPTDDKRMVQSFKEFQYYDSITHLSVVLPGKPFEIDKEGVLINLIYREMGQGNTYIIEVLEKKEGQTLESVADDYIQGPGDAKKKELIIDNETSYIEGISDSYPEGLAWVRVIDSDNYFAILKAYGGNKFMNSKRPHQFFEKVWFAH